MVRLIGDTPGTPAHNYQSASYIHGRGYEMPHGFHNVRVRQLVKSAAATFRVNDWTLNQIDPDGLRYLATISVRANWFVAAIALIELVYRPNLDFGVARYATFVLLVLVLIGFNGYIHYRILSNRRTTWRWLFALYALDVFLVSAMLALSYGFSHDFVHLFYYPALALMAVLFASFRLNMAWVTITSLVYVAISLTVGDGIDTEAGDEKTLLARIAVMYVVVAAVNLATRFERMRWGQSVERERALQRERVELSQAIHDTAAQSAYMVGLGIDTAKAIAGDANPELTATLEAASRLSRSVILELRHPINVGGIYEGRELSGALRSHATSFTNVTSVPVEMTHTGVEPPLSIEARSLLFSIAHNALTNAYRHAKANRVAIDLEFAEEDSRLSVSDDGVGLPDDYADRGNGFANMNRAAERLGGRLAVEQRGAMGGATVTCVVPREQ